MNQELLEKIEAYLEGQLTKADLASFAAEHEIENLDAEIEWVQNIQLATGVSGLRDQLDAILPNAEKSATEKSKVRPLRIILGVAASIAILVIGYLGLVRTGGTDDLYATYKFEEPGLPVVMGASERYQLDDALTYYGEGNYKEAIRRLEKIDTATIGSDTLQYFLGLSHLYDENPKEAEKYFDKLSSNKSSIFREKGEWLFVLAALQSKSYQAAKLRLDVILKQPEHSFYTEAVNLQEDLQNL